ncbi:dihydroorotase family protein [Candidatus Bathyarchaeota archaeon]|nr:dihydroorotase family protein [Candidatus Bathyarchaeota archaeon]
MIVDSVLTNAKAYFKSEVVDCSIAIEEGKIFKIGKETQMPSADQKVNLKNLLVLPGLIDAHVHLRDEGKAYKEDFFSGTAAAAAGGFSTVLDMPNNDPVTMSVQTLRKRMEIAARKILVNVGFYSEFPDDLGKLQGIVSEGAVGFKLFMGCQVGGLDVDRDEQLKEAFSEVSKLTVPVAVHAEDKSLLNLNEQRLKQAKRNTVDAFLMAHSEEVELKAVQRLQKTSDQTGVHLHFCHVTTQTSLNAIVESKKLGKTVTCEVTPNHLLLSTADLECNEKLLIMAPPLRSKNNVEALWQGINDGTVDSLGSDHAPHTLEEKSASSIWEVKVGVPGLETTLPLMLTMVRKNRLPLSRMVELLAEKPAKIFNLKGKGKLEKGNDADLTVVDFNQKWTICASKFKSKAKFSPYNGLEVIGKPVKTIVNGSLIMDDGEIVAKPGSGVIVRSVKS